MLAVHNAPDTPARVTICEAPEPTPRSGHAVVGVRAFSINRGELALLKTRPTGWQPGQDIAGVVVQPAADGTGPAAGTPVVSVAKRGGWAERVAVDVEQLAPLPDGVDFATAATLPIAAVTALRTLRLGGEVTELADWPDRNRSG